MQKRQVSPSCVEDVLGDFVTERMEQFVRDTAMAVASMGLPNDGCEFFRRAHFPSARSARDYTIEIVVRVGVDE